MVNAAEPSAIKAIVRIPAGFSLRCRSIPTQAPHSSARILSEIDPQGYGNNECQLSVIHCISYGNENANGMQREEFQEPATPVRVGSISIDFPVAGSNCSRTLVTPLANSCL